MLTEGPTSKFRQKSSKFRRADMLTEGPTSKFY
jgi:hypothetical protein